MQKPKGYEDCLGTYGPQLYDSYCGEIIAWGFTIIKQINNRFNELNNFGETVCSYSLHGSTWVLVTKWLSREEAIKKYGAITQEIWGPRGGWKSVTFGTKTFINPHFKSIQN